MKAEPTGWFERVKGRARWWWLVGLVAAPAVYAALAYNIGAHAYDAGLEHIYLGVAYSDAVSQGALYPRWVQFLHVGLGSPLFTFRPPLAYVGMDVLSRLGLPHPYGWQLMIAGALLGGCAGAYLLVLELTQRKWPAFLAAAAFLYTPYVLRNVFERGSTEAFGVLLYPWVLWGLIRLAHGRPSGGRLLLASLVWALCIAAHVLAPLILAPVAAAVAVLLGARYRTAWPLLALVLGGLLTAFIWAPMLAEQPWVQVERDFEALDADPASNPLSLDRLLALPAVYDVVRDNNSTGDRIGLWHVVWLIVGLPASVVAWKRGRHDLSLVLGLATACGILLFWLLTPASDPLWRQLNVLLERLQYRSRWMGLYALIVAIVAGVSLALLPLRWQPRVALVLAGVLVTTALPSLYIELQHRYAPFEGRISLAEVRQAEVSSGGSAFTYFGEFMPRWRTDPYDQVTMKELGPELDRAVAPLAFSIPDAGVVVGSSSVRPNAWDLEVDLAQPTKLGFFLLYYPRWRAWLDWQPILLSPQSGTGYAEIQAPQGIHRIALRYVATGAESAGVVASLLTSAVLVVAALIWRQERRDGIVSGRRSGHAGDYPPCRHRTLGSPALHVTGPSASDGVGREPGWWLLGGLTVLFLAKILYVDGSTTWLRCDSGRGRVCGAQATVDVPFLAAPRLRGYTVEPRAAHPGDTVRMSLFWQGEPGDPARPRRSSFVHIRNSQPGRPVNPRTENELWAQDEHEAPGGILTTDFLPGRLYEDVYRLRLPDDMPPGEYFVETGWADAATGEQLDLPEGAVIPPLRVLWRSVLLPSITVGMKDEG